MKTTKKDFQDFKKWCKFYMDKYGLNDWTVYFVHEDIKGGVASCCARTISRGVTFTLATEPEVAKEDLQVRATARHEVCHALIADLSHMVGQHSTEEEWKKADEQLVCRLTNLLNDEKK